MKTTHIPARVIERVRTKIAVDPDRGCHISTYSAASHGYAQVGWHEDGERIVTLCHRVIWYAEHGPIPKGMTVDHMCKQRKCVRVDHLRLLTNYENARRTKGRDWPLGQCINGHPNSMLHTQRGGKIICAPCMQASRDKWLAKQPRKAS